MFSQSNQRFFLCFILAKFSSGVSMPKTKTISSFIFFPGIGAKNHGFHFTESQCKLVAVINLVTTMGCWGFLFTYVYRGVCTCPAYINGNIPNNSRKVIITMTITFKFTFCLLTLMIIALELKMHAYKAVWLVIFHCCFRIKLHVFRWYSLRSSHVQVSHEVHGIQGEKLDPVLSSGHSSTLSFYHQTLQWLSELTKALSIIGKAKHYFYESWDQQKPVEDWAQYKHLWY